MKLRNKGIIVCGILALLAIAAWAGHGAGVKTVTDRQLANDLQLHWDLVSLDRSFLTNVVTRPNAMASGLYTLETKLAGKPKMESDIELEFVDGRLNKISKALISEIEQSGNVVSWEEYDTDEGPSRRFIGVIDGNGRWGRVYVKPGAGWHQGVPPQYGMWRCNRGPNQTLPQLNP